MSPERTAVSPDKGLVVEVTVFVVVWVVVVIFFVVVVTFSSGKFFYSAFKIVTKCNNICYCE